MTSFVKETFTETDTEPIPITQQQTPEACQVSTQTEDGNTDPSRSSSLEVRMDALKSSLMDEIYNLKNQIEFSNTGKHESDIVFSLREQIKLLKEENENKTFIIKSLLQNQNNLSNMGTNFFLQQRKLQSFDSKEQLNENPESNSSNNDIDFQMEPTIETNTKRGHAVNNTSKTNNDSNNNNIHNKNKEHASNTNRTSKETHKNKDNHKNKENEKSSKERKRKQETKETSADQNTSDTKGKPSIFIMGDSMVKKLNGYLLTKKIKHKGIVKVRPFTTAKVSCMQDHVKPTIRDINPLQIILHVGTNDLKIERTAGQIAKSIIDLSKEEWKYDNCFWYSTEAR